jgi:hypothetical protein
MALQHGFDFVSIEPMTRARIDAHISRKDCSHYCLPGIPDLWLDMAITQLWYARRNGLVTNKGERVEEEEEEEDKTEEEGDGRKRRQ